MSGKRAGNGTVGLRTWKAVTLLSSKCSAFYSERLSETPCARGRRSGPAGQGPGAVDVGGLRGGRVQPADRVLRCPEPNSTQLFSILIPVRGTGGPDGEPDDSRTPPQAGVL